MINALSILSKVKNKRRVAILGDILELGNYSKEIHKEIGNTITKDTLDILITVGNDSNYIKNMAIKNGLSKNSIYSYNDYHEASLHINNIIKENDIILLKASHGIHLEKIVDFLLKK